LRTDHSAAECEGRKETSEERRRDVCVEVRRTDAGSDGEGVCIGIESSAVERRGLRRLMLDEVSHTRNCPSSERASPTLDERDLGPEIFELRREVRQALSKGSEVDEAAAAAWTLLRLNGGGEERPLGDAARPVAASPACWPPPLLRREKGARSERERVMRPTRPIRSSVLATPARTAANCEASRL
jgi:hypothetical protein